jgi:hypothetical protein
LLAGIRGLRGELAAHGSEEHDGGELRGVGGVAVDIRHRFCSRKHNLEP